MHIQMQMVPILMNLPQDRLLLQTRQQEKQKIMNELRIYENLEFGKVRTMEINGEPYFVAKDVAEILGYAKPENALTTHVDKDDTLKQGVTDSLGRTQNTTLINESGLYSLIFSSKILKAKHFKRWVTHEVLPSIRQTGSYSTLQAPVSDFDSLSRRIEALEKETLLRRVDALETAYQNEDDYGSKCYRSVGQVPAHIIAALNCMIDSGLTVGYMLDFLEDNHVWLSNRCLTEYIRKRKADKCGY